MALNTDTKQVYPAGFLPLILASASLYRQQQLKTLNIPFQTAPANIEENQQTNEAFEAMAGRLSQQKAHATAHRFPQHLIIGSDQVATQGTSLLRKPGNVNQAFKQLRLASGNAVVFHTGLALLNTQTGHCQQSVETVKVSFRHLTDAQIETYLSLEQPFDCAGSFKAEGLGISLIAKIECRDFNALIGLPLMALVDMLENEGITLPLQQNMPVNA